MSAKLRARDFRCRPDVQLVRVNSHHELGFLCVPKRQPPVAGAHFEDVRIAKVSRLENCAGLDASRIDFGCHDSHTTTPTRLVARIDPGMVSLVAELRRHERRAAEEPEQGKTREEPKPADASPAAIALALLLTDEDWTCWRRGLETEK
jgi:hypothetical protein